MQNIIFFSLLILTGGYFVLEIFLHYRLAKLGKPENRSDHRLKRFIFACKQVFLHKKIRDFPIFGILHFFLMWGFIILIFSGVDMAANGLYHKQLPFLGTSAVFLFVRDLFMVLVFIGVIGGLLRRLIKRPEWLNNSGMAYIILVLILLIVLTELLFFAGQVALGVSSLPQAAWLIHFAAGIMALISGKTLLWVSQISWWLHFAVIFYFFILIPRSKHLHLVYAFPNVYWHSLEPKGAIRPAKLQGNKAYGVESLTDFTWKQLFDSLACVKCGRCNGQCPARQSDEAFKPKKVNGRLRKYLEQNSLKLFKNNFQNRSGRRRKAAKPDILEKKMVDEIFEEQNIWNCSTCGACMEACPIMVEHTSKIIDMRRYLISRGRNMPPEMKKVFSAVNQYGNPYGQERREAALTKELQLPALKEKPDAEYLLFLGCAASFDQQAGQAARSFIRILQNCKVDFAVLDGQEWCCGETVRRMGNELLFQKTVKKNIAAFTELNIKKILTTCPHCFNTFKNEYPQFGGSYEVIPHSVFLSGLMRQDFLRFPREHNNYTVTYQDPCYLGRYNGYYEEPRRILKAMPGVRLLEMPRYMARSFCCGAGGGRYWTMNKSDNSISENRRQEALETGAEFIVTACPYCRNVLQPAGQETSPVTLDIAEFMLRYGAE